MRWSDGPVNGANILYYSIDTWDPAHLEDVIDLVAFAGRALYSDVLTTDGFPTTWQLRLIKVGFRDAVDSEYRSARVGDVVGTSTDESAPGQACRMIDWVTNDPRKGGKARTYIGGMPDGWLADSARLDPTILTAVNSHLADYLSTLFSRASGTASGPGLLEMSFVDGKADRAEGFPYPVRAGFFQPIVCTQRRRVDRLLA